MPGYSTAHGRLARLVVLITCIAGCSGGGSGGSGESPTTVPALTLSTGTVSFSGRSFGAELAPRTVTVTNGGEGTLAPPELSVTYGQGSGWLSAGVTGTSAPYTITLKATTELLPAGTYTATVVVASAGASNSPRSISVTLTLTPTWTVFVYGHADGDRPMSFLRDLQEMREAALGDSVTVVVAADFPEGRSDPEGVRFPAGTVWYRFPGTGELARFVDEEDFDDPDVLRTAVANAFHAYPADHHAVVLWGRGASWRGFGGDENGTPGDPTDDGAGLTGAAIAAALSGALVELGHTSPLAFVAFDASSMMGQEVAYELRDVARVFIASAEVELGGGWDYTASLGRLGADPSLSPFAFAAAEVQDWDAHHTGPADLLVRAHAALDLTQIETYAAAWQAIRLGLARVDTTVDWPELARRQYAATPGYAAGDPADPSPRTSLRDAGQFLIELGHLTSDPVVAAAADGALASLDAIVISSATGDVRLAETQAGVHFEGTLGGSWLSDAFTYELLAWHATTGWGDVLGWLAGNDDGVPPDISISPHTTGPFGSSPPSLQLTSQAADVAGARLYLAAIEDANVRSHGVIADRLVEPGTPYELVWDGKLPSLSDIAGATAEVFVRPWLRGPSGSIFLLPGTIGDGAATVAAYAILVEGQASLDAVAVGVNGSLAVLPLSDFGGLQFTPALYDETLQEWRPVMTPLAIPSDPAASLTFQRTSAPAGLYRLRTTVADVWGNVAEESHDVTVDEPFGT